MASHSKTSEKCQGGFLKGWAVPEGGWGRGLIVPSLYGINLIPQPQRKKVSTPYPQPRKDKDSASLRLNPPGPDSGLTICEYLLPYDIPRREYPKGKVITPLTRITPLPPLLFSPLSPCSHGFGFGSSHARGRAMFSPCSQIISSLYISGFFEAGKNSRHPHGIPAYPCTPHGPPVVFASPWHARIYFNLFSFLLKNRLQFISVYSILLVRG